jgi:hypothetical protein
MLVAIVHGRVLSEVCLIMVDDDKHPLLAGRIPAIGEDFFTQFFIRSLGERTRTRTVRSATLNSRRVGAAFGTPFMLAWLSKSSGSYLFRTVFS